MKLALSEVVVVVLITLSGPSHGQSAQLCGKSAEKCKCSETEVDCTNAGLTKMPEKEDLPLSGAKLQTLILVGNKIKTVNKKDMHYPNLTKLDLSRQEIKGHIVLADDALEHAKQVKDLSFDSNRVKYPISSRAYSNVERLCMRNVTIVGAFGNIIEFHDTFKNLKQLILTHNKIPFSYPDLSFECMENLEMLDLGFNRFRQVPSFNQSMNLVNISLNENLLANITKGSFKGLNKLRTLSLDNNHDLESVDETAFDECPNLEKLSMQGSNLTAIPSAIRKLSELEELNLSQSKIRSIEDGSLKNMRSLSILRLANSPELITVQNSAFSSLPNLATLDLSGNAKLENIEPGWIDAVQTKLVLDVSNCNLNVLPLLNLDLANLEIRAGGNQWECSNPDNQALADVCRRRDCSAICKYPASMEGKNIAVAMPRKANVDTGSLNVAEIATIVVVAVLVVLIIAGIVATVVRRKLRKTPHDHDDNSANATTRYDRSIRKTIIASNRDDGPSEAATATLRLSAESEKKDATDY